MVGLLVTLACSPLPAGDATRPDIILVSIDSLRRDHLSAYGYGRNTSPFLKELASEGSRFENARSASPWTLPAHMSLFTGLWPTQHTVVEDTRKLSASLPMITELLREEGWQTGGFVSTFYVSKHYGFGRGFKYFQDYHIEERTNLLHGVRADQIMQDAMGWAKKQPKGKPIFLFLHLYDVHYPYLPPQDYAERFNPAYEPAAMVYKNYDYYQKNPPDKEMLERLEGQYDECIAAVDAQLRWLHNQWGRSGRKADWLVTADHGEEFGERGSWGHAHTLFPEVLDIPLIAAGPDFPVSVRTEEVGHIDLASTFAAIAGKKWAGPGMDLRQPLPSRIFLAETSRFDSARLSLEQNGKRLDEDRAHGAEALYDRQSDPAEKSPLGGDTAPFRATLLRTLGEPCTLNSGVLESSASLWQGENWVTQVDASQGRAHFGIYPPDASFRIDGAPAKKSDPRVVCQWQSKETSLDPQTRQQLQELGYLQNEDPP